MRLLVRSDGFVVAYSPEVAQQCPDLEVVEAETVEEAMRLAAMIAEVAPAREAQRTEMILMDQQAMVQREKEQNEALAVVMGPTLNEVLDTARALGMPEPTADAPPRRTRSAKRASS